MEEDNSRRRIQKDRNVDGLPRPAGRCQVGFVRQTCLQLALDSQGLEREIPLRLNEVNMK